MTFSNCASEPQHIRLAPILQDPFDYSSPSDSLMFRTPSISSASSQDLSANFHNSRSTSPTLNYSEPTYDHSAPLNRLAMTTNHLRTKNLNFSSQNPYPTPNRSIRRTSIDSEPSVPGKVSQKKRKDRHLYAQQGSGNDTSKPDKRELESGRRYNQARSIADLQNLMLESNPSLPVDAMPREGREQGGWLELKSNNVSQDIETFAGISPLKHGKMDIFESAILFMEHSNRILEDVVRELQDFRNAVAMRVRSRASHEELLEFLEHHVVNNDFEYRVAKSSAHRAGRNWRRPSDM